MQPAGAVRIDRKYKKTIQIIPEILRPFVWGPPLHIPYSTLLWDADLYFLYQAEKDEADDIPDCSKASTFTHHRPKTLQIVGGSAA